jgi:hypothetical protein
MLLAEYFPVALLVHFHQQEAWFAEGETGASSRAALLAEILHCAMHYYPN